MSSALAALAELVRRESGIVTPPSRYAALGAALRRAAPGVEPATFLRLASDRVSGPAAVARLLDEVTVKESSFFREREQLEEIDWRALLEGARAAGAGAARVWSAGCAAGQEAYTLAILACESLGGWRPPVEILATDICRSALEQARAGRYRPRSLPGLEPDLRERYLEHVDDDHAIVPRLRELVSFARHNLVRDPAPPPGEERFDLILCRNVLIYFDPETATRVAGSLEGALRPGGRLLIGAADRLAVSGRTRAAPPPADRQPPRAPAPARRESPLDAEAYFLRGLAALEAGDAAGAVGCLRRALYVDPAFGLAAFGLGRAHDAAGDRVAARRAYGQALRTLAGDERRHDLLGQLDVDDVAAACRARLEALR